LKRVKRKLQSSKQRPKRPKLLSILHLLSLELGSLKNYLIQLRMMMVTWLSLSITKMSLKRCQSTISAWLLQPTMARARASSASIRLLVDNSVMNLPKSFLHTTKPLKLPICKSSKSSVKRMQSCLKISLSSFSKTPMATLLVPSNAQFSTSLPLCDSSHKPSR